MSSQSDLVLESDANKALAIQFFDAWTAGDFDSLAGMVDPDGQYWTLHGRKTILLSEMIKRVRATYGEAQSGLTFTVDTLTAEDDRVSVILQGEADFPDREHYLQLYHVLMTFAGGRVRRLALYYDTALSNRVMRGEGGAGPLPSHAPGYKLT
jgi:ketosteroid isomerase-like protein